MGTGLGIFSAIQPADDDAPSVTPEIDTPEPITLEGAPEVPATDTPVEQIEEATVSEDHSYQLVAEVPEVGQIVIDITSSHEGLASRLASTINTLISDHTTLITMLEADGTALELRIPPDPTAFQLRDITEQEAADYIAQAKDIPAQDVFDVMSSVLAVQILDPILNKIRHRDIIKKHMLQLSKAIQGLTYIAETLRLEVDESPVRTDSNFANWDEEHLQALVTAIVIASTKHQTTIDSYKEAISSLKETVSKREELVNSSATIVEMAASGHQMQISSLTEKLHRSNTLLSRFHTAESFLVVKIDPTTRLPKRYAIQNDEAELNTSTKVEKATRLPTMDEALKLRRAMYVKEFSTLEKKSRKLAMSDKEAIRDSWIVAVDSIQELPLYDEEE